MRGLLSQITKVASRVILETPKNCGEALWRFTSLSAVTSFMVSAVLLWRYPKIVHRIALGGSYQQRVILDIFRRNPVVKKEALKLIGDYITRWRPDRIAIINWTTKSGIVQVWSNELTSDWPTATNGVMSWNLIDAIGYMFFDQCWVGKLDYTAPLQRLAPDTESRDWLVCGLSDGYSVWGFLLVNWENSDPPRLAVEELEALSRHLEMIIFGNP